MRRGQEDLMNPGLGGQRVETVVSTMVAAAVVSMTVAVAHLH